MKRKCVIIKKSGNGRIAIAFDRENKQAIMDYVGQNDKFRKKFNHIVGIILEGLRNTQLYDKEDINEKCKDVTAMKFFKGGENGRLYCKEIKTREGMLVVVAAAVHHKKKSQKNSKKEISIIEAVGGYEYEIEQ